MKIVNTFNPEFGYELISAVPYAYYLFINNKLEKTISGTLSEPLYYFSPNHEINPIPRSWENTIKLINSDIPNASIHKSKLDTSKFIVPPYKKQFANNIYKWEKPTICICNRYNEEWRNPPINYFSLEMLEKMFNILKDKYQIIYFGVDILDEMQDSAHSIHLGDSELCDKYNDVILFQKLLKNSGLSWNELQLQIYANCDKFITMNGGYSILASFFGGTNLIYCKQSTEINPNINSFYRWYPEFANSRIVVTQTYDETIEKMKMVFFDEYPLINIIIQTQKNESGFIQCIESIHNQTHKNINIVVGIETNDNITDEYVLKEKCRVVFYNKENIQNIFNTLIKKIEHGLVICINDTEKYDDIYNLENIIKNTPILYEDDIEIVSNKMNIYIYIYI